MPEEQAAPPDSGAAGEAGGAAVAPPVDRASEPETTSEDPTVGRLTGVLAQLAALDELPVGEHPDRYDALHSELTDGLAAVDLAASGGA